MDAEMCTYLLHKFDLVDIKFNKNPTPTNENT